MIYEEVINKLESVDIDTCYPLYVPSILRPAHYLYRDIIQLLPNEYRKKKVYYITRDSWYKQYKEAQPDVNIVVIPKEYEYPGYGLDTTRKFIFDLAYSNGDKYIFDWDDDINNVAMIYSGGINSRKFKKADREKYAMQILTLASNISSQAFEKYPQLCLGQLGTITPSTCLQDYHKTKIIINKGSIPRRTNIINVFRMKSFGMERTGKWDKQSEDLGTTFMILNKGGWCFTIPNCVYSAPMKNNPRTEPILHGDENNLWDEAEKLLLADPVGEYLTYAKTESVCGGRRRPQGVNWNKWNKDHNLTSIIEEW